MKCSETQCKAQCLPEFQFPSKVNSMILNCIGGRWIVKNSNSADVPICERNEKIVFPIFNEFINDLTLFSNLFAALSK